MKLWSILLSVELDLIYIKTILREKQMKRFNTNFIFDENELRELWEQCIFVLDTNVLLNLYKYTSDTQEQMINLLSKIKDRLWIPNQVALEFHSNRYEIIQSQLDVFSKIRSIINTQSEDISTKINNELKPYKRKRLMVEIEELMDEFRGFISDLGEKIDEKEKQQHNFYKDDYILKKVTELFIDKVGEGFSQEQLNEIYNEGEKRYADERPPGYKDLKEKKGEFKYFEGTKILSEYGDLIIWKQIINKSTLDSKPVIFITDDEKEDWWNIVKNRVTTGPRYELINEFNNKTGQRFYMYKAYGFMEKAKEYIDDSITPEAILEAKELKIDSPNVKKTERSFHYLTDRDKEYFEGLIEKLNNESNPDKANYDYQKILKMMDRRNSQRLLVETRQKRLDFIYGALNALTHEERNICLARLDKLDATETDLYTYDGKLKEIESFVWECINSRD